ncbi:aspartate/glutamate racemase family protein [Rouxiella chamberiensis]|uniref:Aspartate/glutamate racemase family protein n=1 Tax=Rouxiella chamberiensis TaxID=1513468 RepID=A0ABY7HRX7_9GAMM|nr:aspartate/glutamate racemase family protein [Rouxiella chamberiensis]WAT02143.1 aspartate/glutamate racemase family protein [Rouxiella chamberiensis]
MSHRVVLLHATPVAMSPIHTAFQEVWPEAELVNLLDDGLSTDRARESELSESMIARFVRFGHYGYDMKADGILITCSAFGPAIDQLASELPIPVLKPNEAMFHEAVAQGNNIGMLATFGPSVETMTDEFDSYVAEHGAKATLTTILVDDAIDLLKKGDAESHNRLVAARAKELAHCDVIMLAHFSTSRAAAAVRENVTVPVLTAPHAAVNRIKASILAAEKE